MICKRYLEDRMFLCPAPEPASRAELCELGAVKYMLGIELKNVKKTGRVRI